MICNLYSKIKGCIVASFRVDEFKQNQLTGRLSAVPAVSGDITEGCELWCLFGDMHDKYRCIVKEFDGNKICVFIESTGDKRMYLRAKVNLHLPVLVMVGKEGISHIDVLVDNISFGGVGFICNKALDEGIEIILKLPLVREYNFEGVIKHIEKIGEKYYYGVQFKPFALSYKEDALYTFIEERLPNKEGIKSSIYTIH